MVRLPLRSIYDDRRRLHAATFACKITLDPSKDGGTIAQAPIPVKRVLAQEKLGFPQTTKTPERGEKIA